DRSYLSGNYPRAGAAIGLLLKIRIALDLSIFPLARACSFLDSPGQTKLRWAPMGKTVESISGFILLLGLAASGPAAAQSAHSLIADAANAMGGMPALKALKSQVVESEGKQFNASLSPQLADAPRQISSFRYTLTRDLNRPRVKLVWDGRGSA